MARSLFLTIRLRHARLVIAPVLAVCLVALTALQKAHAPGRDATFPLLNRVIVVDPGHGGIDPGCHLGDVTEKEISLEVGLLLAEDLQSRGSRVFITRTADVELSPYGRTQRTRHGRDLEARVLLAESHQGEIFVSLHVNAAASDGMGGGMVFYHRNSEEGKRLAHAILTHLEDVTPGNQNAALPADFYVLRHSSVPAVLVEMGFLTHRADRAILLSAEGKGRLAQAIAQGVADYLSGVAAPVDETLASSSQSIIPGPSGLTPDGGHECPLPQGRVAWRGESPAPPVEG